MTTTERLTSIPLQKVFGDGVMTGCEHKHIYTTPSGKKWMGKTETASKEFDTYVVLRAAGAVIPDIGIRTIEDESCCKGKSEVLIEWLDNASTLGSFTDDHQDHVFTKEQYIESFRIAVVDYLIDNGDRHDYNILFDGLHLIAIDGGHSFSGYYLSTLTDYIGMSPLADLMWDSLTDVFSSIADVMLIVANIIRSIRKVLSEIRTFDHRNIVESRLNTISQIVLEWYRENTRQPSFKIVSES